MSAAVRRVLLDDGGAAIVEYAIILSGISLTSIVALQLMGTALNGLYAGLVANWSAAAHSGQ